MSGSFVPSSDLGRSVDLSRSTTLLLNAETGEAVPHWVEWDQWAGGAFALSDKAASSWIGSGKTAGREVHSKQNTLA